MNKKSGIILLIAVLGHFCVDMMIGVWAVFKTVVHLDLALAGLISALSAFIGEGMQLYFGHLSDRGQQKKLLVLGLIAVTGASLLSYFHHTLWFFSLFLITCLGSGAFHPTAANLIGSLDSEKKGLLFTIFAAGGALGMAVSQLVFTSIYSYCNGHTVFMSIPPFLLILFILFFFVSTFPSSKIEPTGTHGDAKNGFFNSLKSTLGLLKNGNLKKLYFFQLCMQSVFWGFLFFLPDMLLEREYASWIAFGGGHLVAILGGVFMLLPAGYLADRYSCKKVLVGTTCISIFCFYTLVGYPSLPNALLLFLLFILGASLNISNAISVAFGNQLLPEHPGKIGALLMGFVWCISEGIGQGGGGFLTKLFSEDAPAKALALMGGLFFMASGLVWKLPHFNPVKEQVKIPEEVVHDSMA